MGLHHKRSISNQLLPVITYVINTAKGWVPAKGTDSRGHCIPPWTICPLWKIETQTCQQLGSYHQVKYWLWTHVLALRTVGLAYIQQYWSCPQWVQFSTGFGKINLCQSCFCVHTCKHRNDSRIEPETGAPTLASNSLLTYVNWCKHYNCMVCTASDSPICAHVWAKQKVDSGLIPLSTPHYTVELTKPPPESVLAKVVLSVVWTSKLNQNLF